MTLIHLTRAWHGKSAYALYTLTGHKLHVYLGHNKPTTKHHGDFTLSCYLVPNEEITAATRHRTQFDTYADFVEYRKMLTAAHN